MDDPLVTEYLRIRAQSPTGADGYYQITFTADEEGNLQHSIQTSWCGYTETRPRREIRDGRLFNPEPQKEWLEKDMNESCVIVNDENDLYIFFLWGGHALIEKSVADKHLADLVGPGECMKDSSHLGFVDSAHLPKIKTQHAPSKKLRMEVIQRDEFRCRVCGRSPSEYVDVELHVHHIIPWGIGGITESENLITICKTCHDGLEPHYSPDLSTLHKEKPNRNKEHSERYIDGIKNYQLALARQFNEENA